MPQPTRQTPTKYGEQYTFLHYLMDHYLPKTAPPVVPMQLVTSLAGPDKRAK